MDYNKAKIEEIFKEHKISQFEVKNVFTNKNEIIIHVLPKEILGEYLAKKAINYLKFRSGNIIYEVKRSFINISGLHIVYMITEDGSIKDAFSLYEIKRREHFSNNLLLVNIDEIITEV